MLLGRLRRYGNAFIVMSPTSPTCRRRPRRDKKMLNFVQLLRTSPMHRRRGPSMRGQFSKWKPQIFDRGRRGRAILRLEIHNNAFETQNYIIKLQKQPSDDLTGTRPCRLRRNGNHIIVSVPAASPTSAWTRPRRSRRYGNQA